MELEEKHIVVLRYLASGLTSTEIGAKLAISSRTVESHTHFLKARIGAKNIPHLIALAYDNGILTSKTK